MYLKTLIAVDNHGPQECLCVSEDPDGENGLAAIPGRSAICGTYTLLYIRTLWLYTDLLAQMRGPGYITAPVATPSC